MATTTESYILGFVFLLMGRAAFSNDVQCGGFLNKTSGNLTYPSYPQPYEPGLECDWIIPGPSYIWIKELVLDSGDHLLVYNGSKNSTVIHNFTGTQGFGVVYSSADNTTIVFISANITTPKPDRKFILLYNTTECVVSVPESENLLQSPYFIQSPGTINCTYVININSPEHIIDLTFVQFRLKKGQLSVKSGESTLATYQNGDDKPDDLLVQNDSLNINMLLSASWEQNFTLAYSKWDKDCSLVTYINSTVNISSPSQHGNYDNNLHCLLVLASPTNTTLRLEFSELSLADVNDQVVIKDGGSLLADNIAVMSAGSSNIGNYFLTRSNVTMIKFTTDQLLTERGYQLIVTPQAYGRRFVDSGHFTLGIPPNMTNAILQEPVLPSSDVISYQFQAQEDSQVYLEFGKDTVMFPNTTIECYNGFTTDDELVGYFMTTSAFHPVFSSGSRLLVRIKGFLHNGEMTHQYLSGSFKAVSNDGTLYNSLDDTGGLTLSLMEDEYPWKAAWLIHNYEATELISLKLHLVTVGVNSSVSVYEGLSDQSWMVAKINASVRDVPEIYISKLGQGCRLTYETSHPPDVTPIDQLNVGTHIGDMRAVRMRAAGINHTKEQTVLRATYSRKEDCKVNITDRSGMILTPGYPGLYPFNADCFWNISVPSNKMIHLTFNSFDLAPHHGLQVTAVSYHDYNVTVGNETKHIQNVSTTNLGMYGGRDLLPDIISDVNNSHIELRFSSGFERNPAGGVYVAQGVNISYEVIDCGGNMTNGNATLDIPTGVVGDDHMILTCVWVISLPNISHANGSVDIISFTYHFTQTNTSSLVIRDGASAASETIPLNASDVSDKMPLLSRTDKLWIKYTFQANKNGNQDFQLNYTTYVCPKSQQCNNSICMHDDWRCNGRDDCGDGSDEDGCTYTKPGKQGYAGWALGVAIVATFFLTIILTIIFLMIYRRYRYSNYSELRDLMAPVPT